MDPNPYESSQYAATPKKTNTFSLSGLFGALVVAILTTFGGFILGTFLGFFILNRVPREWKPLFGNSFTDLMSAIGLIFGLLVGLRHVVHKSRRKDSGSK